MVSYSQKHPHLNSIQLWLASYIQWPNSTYLQQQAGNATLWSHNPHMECKYDNTAAEKQKC